MLVLMSAWFYYHEIEWYRVKLNLRLYKNDPDYRKVIFIETFLCPDRIGGSINDSSRKYGKSYFMPPVVTYDWVKKDTIEKAPIWCSVDLWMGTRRL